MQKSIIFHAAIVALTTGCSGGNSYQPPAGAPAAKIYIDACSGCHKSVKELALSPEMASAEAVSNKVMQGSVRMPSFPNIQGDALRALSQYVVDNGGRK